MTEHDVRAPSRNAIANIRRLREGQRVTYVELSRRLAAYGHPLPVLALRRIERGQRRIDVDDLIALAHVFGVQHGDLLDAAPTCKTCGGSPAAGHQCLTCGACG